MAKTTRWQSSTSSSRAAMAMGWSRPACGKTRRLSRAHLRRTTLCVPVQAGQSGLAQRWDDGPPASFNKRHKPSRTHPRNGRLPHNPLGPFIAPHGPSIKPLFDSLVGAWGCTCAGRCSHVAQQSFASWVHTQATKAAAAAHTGRFVLQARMRPRDVR